MRIEPGSAKLPLASSAHDTCCITLVHARPVLQAGTGTLCSFQRAQRAPMPVSLGSRRSPTCATTSLLPSSVVPWQPQGTAQGCSRQPPATRLGEEQQPHAATSSRAPQAFATCCRAQESKCTISSSEGASTSSACKQTKVGACLRSILSWDERPCRHQVLGVRKARALYACCQRVACEAQTACVALQSLLAIMEQARLGCAEAVALPGACRRRSPQQARCRHT